ncbi:hypothetical protein HOY82DRAFT_233560 [Tuber indicum]|nr:hypothetical protein HOY82DRAFT_233560 [Tuber indicum]
MLIVMGGGGHHFSLSLSRLGHSAENYSYLLLLYSWSTLILIRFDLRFLSQKRILFYFFIFFPLLCFCRR